MDSRQRVFTHTIATKLGTWRESRAPETTGDRIMETETQNEDGQAGIDWWNALPEHMRATWPTSQDRQSQAHHPKKVDLLDQIDHVKQRMERLLVDLMTLKLAAPTPKRTMWRPTASSSCRTASPTRPPPRRSSKA